MTPEPASLGVGGGAPRCPTCGATAIVVATVFGGDDPHETWMCRAWKRCGRYFRVDLRGPA